MIDIIHNLHYPFDGTAVYREKAIMKFSHIKDAMQEGTKSLKDAFRDAFMPEVPPGYDLPRYIAYPLVAGVLAASQFPPVYVAGIPLVIVGPRKLQIAVQAAFNKVGADAENAFDSLTHHRAPKQRTPKSHI